MKIDVKLISAALNDVLERNQVAPQEAVPLRTLSQYWEAVRLRASDLAYGIEELHRLGQIGLEARGDGLWVRRESLTSEPTRYGRLAAAVDGLVTGLALERVQLRRPDGYSGRDRRSHSGVRQA